MRGTVKKACIFDLDGTLANTITSIAYFGNAALKESGRPPVEEDRYRYLVGNGADNLMRGMLQTVKPGYTEAEVKALRIRYDGFYESAPLFLVSNYPGVPELLKELSARRIKLAVLSNKPHNVTSMIIKELFPAGTFSCCYGQRPQVDRKPSPQGALLIAQELGVKPEECLYIGDTDVDMKTGRAAGMTAVGVLWGFRGREELERSKADHIVAEPQEILALL